MTWLRRLIWDPGNVHHIARHEVLPAEVEEVCGGNVIAEQGYADRLRLVGPTLAGRMLAVVLAPEPQGGDYYVITARPASRKERRMYQERKQEEAR